MPLRRAVLWIVLDVLLLAVLVLRPGMADTRSAEGQMQQRQFSAITFGLHPAQKAP